MNSADALKEFEEAGRPAKKGILFCPPVLHSDTYLNKSIVSKYPDRTERPVPRPGCKSGS